MVNVFRTLHAMSSIRPPPVRKMIVLDRGRFTCDFNIPILKVNTSSVNLVSKLTKKYFLKLDNFIPVQDDSISEKSLFKIIYYNPDKINKWIDFEESIRMKLIENSIEEKNFDSKKVTLTYENWRTDDIFKAVLPEDHESVSGYSLIGHIIHLNLRDHLLPYRHLIGQVLLDKTKICRTVVNKVNIINNTYRNFTMEVIAGEEDFNVTVKENNMTFQFDFSKVYWNPRLGKEHERIVKLLRAGDVLFDVFSGVGPFAIPAAKKKCIVYANDLNPESYRWLNHNAQLNKVKSEFKSFNMDGGDFIKEHLKNYLKNLFDGSIKLDDEKIHVTMNLPGLAVNFLNNFNGLLKDVSVVNDVNTEIIVHVYCFTYGNVNDFSANEVLNKNLGYNLTKDHIVEVFKARNVAPRKEMMRVSFRLTKSLLLGEEDKHTDELEPPVKKKCA